jgi:hypothetical protein
VTRPTRCGSTQLEWRGRDRFGLATGLDVVLGDLTGTFGQFRDESRVWVRLRMHY